MRTFIAVEIPEYIRKKVDNFITEERKKDLPIKWIAFENLHITLKFLGEIDEKMKDDIIAVIGELNQNNSPFSINLEGIGCFPNPKMPRVLWVGVGEGQEALCKIANQLEERLSQLGFKKERRFHPHLTIARIKKPCPVADTLARDFKTENFKIESIVLFRSSLTPKGSIYEELKKFVLK